jgi:hypothetical protein
MNYTANGELLPEIQKRRPPEESPDKRQVRRAKLAIVRAGLDAVGKLMQREQWDPGQTGKREMADPFFISPPSSFSATSTVMERDTLNVRKSSPEPAAPHDAPQPVVDLIQPAEWAAAGRLCNQVLRKINQIGLRVIVVIKHRLSPRQ